MSRDYHYENRRLQAENNNLKADISESVKWVRWLLLVIVLMAVTIILLLTALI